MASMMVLFGGLTTLNGLFSRRDGLKSATPPPLLPRCDVAGDAVISTVSMACDAERKEVQTNCSSRRPCDLYIISHTCEIYPDDLGSNPQLE